jgi:hypothetical protein
MKDNEKRLFALFMVALMVGTLFASLALHSPATYIPPEPTSEFVISARENVAVTSVPESNNEPAIAVDPNDPLHIVAASNDYGTPNGDAWVGYYVSWDGGETWSRDLIPGYLGGPPSELTGMDLSGDPVVCFDADGNVFISGLFAKRDRNPINPFGFGFNIGRADGIFVAKSTDGGETFNQINILVTAMQTLISFHDKEWMAVDMSNGNVYVVWVVFNALMVATVLLSRSTDNGNSYSTPQVISEFQALEFGSQGSTIQVGPDGTVHVAWIDFNNGQLRYTYSTNSGQSFTTPQSISDVDDIPRDALPNSNYRTPTLLMSAVDLSDTNTSGYLYITWNDYRYGDADILLIYSWDGGQSWSEPIRVNNDEEGNGFDQFFSAVAVSPQGWVHMVFYDRRDDENNTFLWAYYAISKDGGQNFTFNMNMSDENFNGDYSRDGDNDFIGDYVGITATNTTAYAVWCDTRDGTSESGRSEIYFGAVDFSDGSEDLSSEDENK